MTWVPIFDASGAWPSGPQACWDAGYRVIAGYVNQGSWKSFTPAMMARWFQPSHPFSFAPMYEGTGTEPITDPASGTRHATAARAGARALGIPDSVAIAYAVDRDANAAQIVGPVSGYFRRVKAADTCLPIAYLENDGAKALTAAGLIAGGFTPAAYGWGSPAVLMTPANAPSYVLWTQEHNGVKVAGSGDVDAGHIRTTAPIWWRDTTTQEADMGTVDTFSPAALEQLDKYLFERDGALTATQIKAVPDGPRDPKNANGWTRDSALAELSNRLWLIQQLLGGGLADKIATALAPHVTGLTQDEIRSAVADELSTLTLTASAPPPAV